MITAHPGLHTLEHDRLHIRTGSLVVVATRQHRSAASLDRIDLLHEALTRRRRGQRREPRIPRRRIRRDRSLREARELGCELVVDVLHDDHPLRRVARLAVVAHPRLEERLRRLLHIRGVKEHVRIRTAHLQDDLLEVLARLRSDRGTGTLRTGHRHTMVLRRRQDDVRHLLIRRVDVDVRIRRHTRLMEDLLHQSRGLRVLRRVLEQNRVAQRQVRSRKTRHLVVREVPRHDAQQRTDRLATHERFFVLAGAAQLLISHELLGVVREVAVDQLAQLDLALRLRDGLAHLHVDDLSELIRALAIDVRNLREDRRALRHRGLRPAGERRCAALLRVDDLLVGGSGVCFHDFAGCRVEDLIDRH